MTSDTLLSNMQQEYNELVKKSQKAKGADKQVISQQLAHISKLMKGIVHNTSEMELRKQEAYNELCLLKRYLVENKVVDYCVLDDIRDKARAQAKDKKAEDEKLIDKLYGEFRNVCNNNTKRDPTAKEALKNL